MKNFRRVFSGWLAVGVALLLLAVACGGDVADAVGVEDQVVIHFEVDVEKALDQTRAGRSYEDLDATDQHLLRLAYLSDVRALVEEGRQINRDLETLSGMVEQGIDVDQSWVSSVHEVTRDQDVMVDLIGSFRLPRQFEEEYGGIHGSFVRGFEASSYGGMSLLRAATVRGPGGDSVAEMEVARRGGFRSSVSQADFFLYDAGVLFTQTLRAIDDLLEAMRLDR